MDFGLKDLGMGLFLVMTNITIAALCIWLGYARYLKDRRKVLMRRGKVYDEMIHNYSFSSCLLFYIIFGGFYV